MQPMRHRKITMEKWSMLGRKSERGIPPTESGERVKPFSLLKQELLKDAPTFSPVPHYLKRVLTDNSPPSLEFSGKRWMEVAPIKHTDVTDVTDVMPSTSDHGCLHGQQGRCHHDALEDRQGNEKISTKQTGLGGESGKTEPSAPHAAQRGQTEPFQPHPGMATFLHMPPASLVRHIPIMTTWLPGMLHAKWAGITSSGMS